MSKRIIIDEPPVAQFLFSNTKTALFWLIVRVYVGYAWLMAGIGKVGAEAWTGDNAGAAVEGFVQGALTKMEGDHPDVQAWYGWFLENAVLPYTDIFGHVIAYGEVLVGVALIVGLFVGIAAFFGIFMNANFLLAGTVSSNPVLFILTLGILMAWRVAGYIGLDRWVLLALGTPWQPKVWSEIRK
ncbi:MAG: DoxX family membrane protein [Candidatus Paceibacterota bacterium]